MTRLEQARARAEAAGLERGRSGNWYGGNKLTEAVVYRTWRHGWVWVVAYQIHGDDEAGALDAACDFRDHVVLA